MYRITLVPKKIIENLCIVGVFYFALSYLFFYLSLIGISNGLFTLLVVVSCLSFVILIVKSFKNVIFLENAKILIKDNKENHNIILTDVNKVNIVVLDTNSISYQFFLNNGNSINYVLDNRKYNADINNKFLTYLNNVKLI